MLRLNRDTQLCVSMSARPSNVGTRFHNHLYENLGLNFVYKAFAPTNLAAAISGVRGLPIRGAAISMPYKMEVIPLLDEVDATAAVIGAVNTVVNTDGYLVGSNTDFIAVRTLLQERLLHSSRVTVFGSGGMAKAVVAAAVDLGHEVTVVSRNLSAGKNLAQQFKTKFAASTVGGNVFVNATPVGMAGLHEKDSPLTDSEIEQFDVIFDVVAMPVQTPLLTRARELGKHLISGREVMTLQAVEQFEMYTGVRPKAEQIAAAEAFAHRVD